MGKLTTMLVALAVLRAPAPWSASSEEASLGFPQLVVILGVVLLLSLLVGAVIWRVRRTRQK